MVQIRSYSEGDLTSILAIEKSTFPQPWTESFFRYIASGARDLFMVAIEADILVGYIVGEVKDSRDALRGQLRWGHVLNVAVREGWRGQGIGSSLLDTVEARMKAGGASQVLLEVRISNVEAQELYRRRGYVVTGRVRDYYVDEDALIMVKYFSEIAGII
jgi:ribosomal-protein-alanine N-acetyltransferase